FARDLTSLKIERVAVAVVRRIPEHAHAPVIVQPTELPVVGDVAPDQILPLAVPGRPFGPERAGPESHDRRVEREKAIERGGDDQAVWIRIRRGRPTGPEVARGIRDGARRIDRFSRRVLWLLRGERARSGRQTRDGPQILQNVSP